MSARAMLCVLALLAATTAQASDADRITDALSQHLTHHGKDVVRHEARLVEIGDVSFSGLKDDLREACKTAQECLRARDLSVEEMVLAMSMLVARRTEEELSAKIKAMEARNERLRRLNEELGNARDRHEIDRLRGEIERLNHEAQLSMIDLQRMVTKRNEAFDMLTLLLNKQQRALDSIINNMR